MTNLGWPARGFECRNVAFGLLGVLTGFVVSTCVSAPSVDTQSAALQLGKTFSGDNGALGGAASFVAARDAGAPNDAPLIVAYQDPQLSARVLACTALAYDDGPNQTLDRPAFVRAASGLAAIGDQLAVLQDDAQFLGLWHPSGSVTSLPLPPGPGDRRRFEERFHNRHLKFDLEAALSLADGEQEVLVGFGSGSIPERQRILLVLGRHKSEQGSGTGVARHESEQGRGTGVALLDGAALYSELARAAADLGATLNLEGAAVQGGRLLLAHRGSGARHSAADSAVFTVDASEFLAWLRGSAAVPSVSKLQRYDLGVEQGVPYGFSGLGEYDERAVLFTASAEDTASPLDDGAVLGSRIGVIEEHVARWTPLVNSAGEPLSVKAESTLLKSGSPDRVWVVLDPDDPDAAAALCEVELRGAWPRRALERPRDTTR